MTTLTESAQWQTLESLAQLVKKEHMRNWFTSDENRAADMNAEACGASNNAEACGANNNAEAGSALFTFGNFQFSRRQKTQIS